MLQGRQAHLAVSKVADVDGVVYQQDSHGRWAVFPRRLSVQFIHTYSFNIHFPRESRSDCWILVSGLNLGQPVKPRSASWTWVSQLNLGLFFFSICSRSVHASRTDQNFSYPPSIVSSLSQTSFLTLLTSILARFDPLSTTFTFHMSKSSQSTLNLFHLTMQLHVISSKTE